MSEEKKAKKLLKDLPWDDPQRVAGEKTRRMYVKRTGGLCKDLTPDQVKKANEACEKYGWSAKDGWDKHVIVGAMGAGWN